MWGEESSYESESFGVNEVDEEGEIISSPHSPPLPPPPESPPCLVIFLVRRKVFPLVHAGEMPLGGCQCGIQLIVGAWSHAGMLGPVGNTCLPRRRVDDLTTWFLAGCLASADCRGSCIRDRVAVLIGRWG
jgi:hypothetical protein